jgi:myo-inositol catabolism protein IolC
MGAIMQELDFKAEEWLSLSLEFRVKKCRFLAAEATKDAVKAPAETRTLYADLAHRWLALADDIAAVDAQVAQNLSPLRTQSAA